MQQIISAFILFFTLFAAIPAGAAAKGTTPPEARYVFLFIGDGMGFPTVAAAGRLKAAEGGELFFPTLPEKGCAVTRSASDEITDSAAAATALACGEKTANRTIGMDATHTRSLTSIAKTAKKNGKCVGILTSVSIDHATPAGFYANTCSRSNYFEIAEQGIPAGFDFMGSGGFITESKGDTNLYDLYRRNGVTILRGKEAVRKIRPKDQRVLVSEREGIDRESLAYRIDKRPGALTLTDLTEGAIGYLCGKSGDKGFFMMVEGGKIDWANHNNDAATALAETIGFDEAVRRAYAFYEQHPDETLIVVTADHETGGMRFAADDSTRFLPVVAQQRSSFEAIERELKGKSWSETREVLKRTLGFWEQITLTPEEEAALKSLTGNAGETARYAKKLVNEKAGLTWSTGGHTGDKVPVYAVGVGAECFSGEQDNTDIPKKLERLMFPAQ